MLSPKEFVGYPLPEEPHLPVVRVAEAVEVLVKEDHEDVGVLRSPRLREFLDYLKEIPVHHYRVRAHFVKRADAVRDVPQDEGESGPVLAEGLLRGSLYELEDLVEVLRAGEPSLVRADRQFTLALLILIGEE